MDGPSAGAAMTTAVYSAITGWAINQSVMMTGTIEEDGSIGNVDDISAKIKASSRVGLRPSYSLKVNLHRRIGSEKRRSSIWIFKIKSHRSRGYRSSPGYSPYLALIFHSTDILIFLSSISISTQCTP